MFRLQFKRSMEQLVQSGQAHPKMARLLEAVVAHFLGLDPAQALPEDARDRPQQAGQQVRTQSRSWIVAAVVMHLPLGERLATRRAAHIKQVGC